MPQTVILLADIPGVGQVGDQKKVKDGFARNYLIPERLAVFATPNMLKKFDRQKEKLMANREKQFSQSKSLGDKLSKVGLVFERVIGPGGKLFGSVSPIDIANELTKQGARVEKKSILMNGPLKSVGDHTVRVRVHSQVIIDVPVKIIGLEMKKSSEHEAAPEEIAVYGQPDDIY